ncbi:hypothetical protein N474_01045 [Pseudoalteromonas luteoviolacea CPMOR-2]|uniref:Uncharacterized protein n=1 Tax=Pseudoalteromonas luteoviolacea DSM 6061 TaxID=1365250 RepID=A0A166XM57_9GAMM|nr:hypothetical protein N475_11450 [Pseudoalteromonas luteoviolacea DSM 6061]KZN55550.1 hypothetical protein N474_01045 [Pseudoalteromonas luteoviolacea CPMOR-2]MBE0389649.1 hypothetical protein [Pseudoalteromonas luteoviolacea DSM 6061]
MQKTQKPLLYFKTKVALTVAKFYIHFSFQSANYHMINKVASQCS